MTPRFTTDIPEDEREALSAELAGGLRHASDCAVYNAPAYDPEPCDCGSARLLVIRALKTAQLALCACHNCLTSDRPDVARSEIPGWVIDHSPEISLIDEALAALGVFNTGSVHG